MQRPDDLELLVRVHPGEDRRALRSRHQRGVRERAQLLARQHALDRQADLTGDMKRDELVVAGDHLERHALASELGDRVADPRLGRVAEQDHALEDEVVLETARVVEAGRRPSRRHRPQLLGRQGSRSHGHQPETIGGRRVDQASQPLVLGRLDGPHGMVLPDVARPRDHGFGRPLGHEERRIGRALHDHAQEAAREVVGKLGELAVRGEVGGRRGTRENGGVEGVREGALEVAVEIRELERPGRLVRILAVDPHRAHVLQVPLGQRPRLVGGQDRDAAQVLDRGEALDEHAAGGEGVRALREVERDDRGQQLGRQAHRERDGEEQRVEDRAVERHVDDEHGDHENRRDAEDQGAEGTDAALEVVLGRALGKPVRDLAVARARPGRRDHGVTGPADDAGAEEDQAVAVVVASGIEIAGARLLGGRRGLAGERRLVDVQVVGVDDPAVGRHDVSRSQVHEVAPHDIVDGDLQLLAVADDSRTQREPRLQGPDCRLRTCLLDEPEDGAHDHDCEDDRGVDLVADDQAHQARADEDEDERARDLGDEDREACAPSSSADRIGTVGAEALGRLCGGQTRSSREVPGRPPCLPAAAVGLMRAGVRAAATVGLMRAGVRARRQWG